MSSATSPRTVLATVDVHDLNSCRWGPLRQLCPGFVEELELGRYLKQLLSAAQCRAVAVAPHQDANGTLSTHVVDIVALDEGAADR